MRLLRRPFSESPKPRPARGADVAFAIEHEENNKVEFDPKRDISRASWEGMKKSLEGLSGVNWKAFSDLASSIFIVFPERRSELKLDEEAFEGMKRKLGEIRDEGYLDWWDFGNMAAHVCLLFPERRSELNLDKEVLDGMKKSLEEYRETDVFRFSFLARSFCVLFPDRTRELILDNETSAKLPLN